MHVNEKPYVSKTDNMHRFQAGDRAKLSIPTKPDYHGQLCIFVRVRDRPGDPPDGRYLLQLENGKQVAMKPGNVIPVEPVRAAELSSPGTSTQAQRGWAACAGNNCSDEMYFAKCNVQGELRRRVSEARVKARLRRNGRG